MHTKAKGQWGRSGPTTSFPKLLSGLSVCEAGRAMAQKLPAPGPSGGHGNTSSVLKGKEGGGRLPVAGLGVLGRKAAPLSHQAVPSCPLSLHSCQTALSGDYWP